MMRLFCSAAASAALLSACATPEPPYVPPPPPPPPVIVVTQASLDCVMAAAEADLFEVESSRVALQRSANPAVRAFAQMMIDDHTRSTNEIGAALQSLGMAPPPPTLGTAMAQRLDALRTTTGPFDAMYMHEQVLAHESALALHQSCSVNAQAPLAGVHASIVPVVQGHLDQARALRDSVQAGSGERG